MAECLLESYTMIVPGLGYGAENAGLAVRCKTHGWDFQVGGQVTTQTDYKSACPIGRIEEATEVALAKIRAETERMELSAADYHALVRTLENPPKPNANLKALMRRKPAWER